MSVLRPVQFISYTEDVANTIFQRHGVGYKVFADDEQFHKSVAPSDVNVALDTLRDCVIDVRQWCESRRLQLNSIESEIIWLGIRHASSKIASADLTLEIGDDVV